MRKTYIVLLFTILSLLSGCISRTKYGSCYGLIGTKEPNLEYKLSVYNVVIAVLFSETIVIPGIVLAAEIYCPIGLKEPGK